MVDPIRSMSTWENTRAADAVEKKVGGGSCTSLICGVDDIHLRIEDVVVVVERSVLAKENEIHSRSQEGEEVHDEDRSSASCHSHSFPNSCSHSVPDGHSHSYIHHSHSSCIADTAVAAVAGADRWVDDKPPSTPAVPVAAAADADAERDRNESEEGEGGGERCWKSRSSDSVLILEAEADGGGMGNPIENGWR